MYIRKLEIKDAPLMLEWMQDESVVQFLNKDFSSMTICDCEKFIRESHGDFRNLHFAIVDDSDTYMGTVSLKNICLDNDKSGGNAEFAIVLRQNAMGKNFSSKAMNEIITYGFSEMNLNEIYWFVSIKNLRALRFYDKNGYKRLSLSEVAKNQWSFYFTDMLFQNYVWYSIKSR